MVHATCINAEGPRATQSLGGEIKIHRQARNRQEWGTEPGNPPSWLERYAVTPSRCHSSATGCPEVANDVVAASSTATM